jgi:D-2-hydroxyglutarate dehydrogenase
VNEVSKVLEYCNQNRIGVVPQGGNTGLVGGGVGLVSSKNRGHNHHHHSTSPEIIISFKHMNKILSVDTKNLTITCEAGCTLQSLNDHLSKYDLMVPLDLGSKGSCHIGGNISTNAGVSLFIYLFTFFAPFLNIQLCQ